MSRSDFEPPDSGATGSGPGGSASATPDPSGKVPGRAAGTDRPSGKAGDQLAEPDRSTRPGRRDHRRLDDVFGDVLPETTADERQPEPPGRDGDAWYLENRPPHHGG
jgi:hypothetical protein